MVSQYHKLHSKLPSRSTGPGGLHNIGNLFALFGGFSVFYFSQAAPQDDFSAIWMYLFGSIKTSCLTLSMLIFLAGGEAYHRGCSDCIHPNPKLIRVGDFLSGVAAVVLTFSLVQFGAATLAIGAGCLLAAGKFGSALFSGQSAKNHDRSGLQFAFRMMAIVSRVPSLAAMGATLYVYAFIGENQTDAILAMVMVLSYLLWLSGDCLLIVGHPVLQKNNPSEFT